MRRQLGLVAVLAVIVVMFFAISAPIHDVVGGQSWNFIFWRYGVGVVFAAVVGAVLWRRQ